MNTSSQTSNLRAECGLRWIVAALLILGALGSAHAEDKISHNANLHIAVTVMPIVQAQAMVQNTEKPANAASVAYRLQPVVARQTREIRSMSNATETQKPSAAVLETLTTLAD